MDEATTARLEARRARLPRKQLYVTTMTARPIADPLAELAPRHNLLGMQAR